MCAPLRWPALAVGVVLSLAHWLYGQDLGGPFWSEGATDPNAGPLFVLPAVTLFALAQRARAAEGVLDRTSVPIVVRAVE